MQPNEAQPGPEVTPPVQAMSLGEQSSIEADQLASQAIPAPEQGSVEQAAQVAADIAGLPSVNTTPEQIMPPAGTPVVEGLTPERGTVTLPEGSAGIVNTNSMTLGQPIMPQPPATSSETPSVQ